MTAMIITAIGHDEIFSRDRYSTVHKEWLFHCLIITDNMSFSI